MDVGALTLIVTLETEEAQGGLLIDHVRTVCPGEIFVTLVFLTNGFVIVPEPETKTQIPVPLVGELPANVAEAVPVVAQMVCEGPALATVGAALVTMVMLEVEAGHEEKLTDHRSTVVPVVNPVMVVLLSVGVVIVPDPEIFVHIPSPTTGIFPAKTAEPTVAQTV